MTERKIPVTVVSGFLGSGKTTLLNRLLALPSRDQGADVAAGRIVVLVNELGAIGLEHAMVRHVNDSVILLDSGCICCTVRGQLVDALRDLFLAGLHKKIPAFSRVLIETTGIADPAPINYTLKYERFLSDRYAYDGCISVVDAVLGAQQLRQEPVTVQQAVLADVLVISKTDLVHPDDLATLRNALTRLNPDAVQYLAQEPPSLHELLQAGSLRANVAKAAAPSTFWKRGGPSLPAHGKVQVLTVSWAEPIKRSAFVKAMSALHDDESIDLLRMKGVLWFQGDEHARAFHGVHKQMYPLALIEDSLAPAGAPTVVLPAREAATNDRASVMVLIFRSPDRAQLERRLAQLLPGLQSVSMSPEGNFAQ